MKLAKEAGIEAESSRLPIFVPKFYLLMWTTLRIKWRNRHAAEEAYKDHIEEFYTRSENDYLEIYEDAFREIRPLLVNAAELQPEDSVLDLATGAGYQAVSFAENDYHVLASDYVYDRVKLSQELAPNQKINWHVADAAHLPLATNSVDVLTMTAALHDMPPNARVNALSEMRRVARKRVIIVEPIAPNNFFLRQIYSFLLSIFDESLYMDNFLASDIEAEFAKAGLKILSKTRCYHNILVMFVCDANF